MRGKLRRKKKRAAVSLKRLCGYKLYGFNIQYTAIGYFRIVEGLMVCMERIDNIWGELGNEGAVRRYPASSIKANGEMNPS